MFKILLLSSSSLANMKIAGEPVIHIVWCFAIIIGALLLKGSIAKLLTKLLYHITKRFSDKKHGETLKLLVQKPLEYLCITILFYIALNQLTVLLDTTIFSRFNEKGTIRFAIHFVDAIDKIFLLFTITFLTWVISRLADYFFHTLIEKAFVEDNKNKEQLLPLMKDVIKIITWTMGMFWVLGSVFNVNIPALITGLGIGGVAIALAAKESVENIFAAFIILTDKPFHSGDSIRLDKFEGTVERVGFRSTRLRNSDGSLVIIPNKSLIGNNLENLSERNARKIKVVVHIKNGISYDQLMSYVEVLENSIKQKTYLVEKPEILLEAFHENSFVLNIFYHLPNPLPEHLQLNAVKREMNMIIYEQLHPILPDTESSKLK